MCFKIQNPIVVEKAKPKIDLIYMPSDRVADEMTLGKLKMLYPVPLDVKYYYTTAKEWAEVFNWIYFKFAMPKYAADRMDCDDFAFLLKGLVASFFELNYFGVVIGRTPLGCHAWNILRTEDEVWQFEPQTGACFPWGEQGYFPEYVLL